MTGGVMYSGGEERFDVVIVGGGPAGTTTAIALALAAPERVRGVVLLEQARYPRDKPCAGALGQRGDSLLGSLGVHADVPGVPIDGMSFRSAQGSVVASPGRIGRVVRRTEFDQALARAAAARGVQVREGVKVEGVSDEGERGAVVATNAGTLRASVVVGCDGVGSVVRRALGLGAGRIRAQAVEVDTEPVAGEGDRSLLHFDASDPHLRGYAWDFPTLVNSRRLVCRGVYALRGEREPGEPTSDVGALLAKRLRRLGIDPASCKNKRYAERGYESTGPISRGRLMLVGEAAGIDPLTGEGIAQAIEYGVLAGRFLGRRLARGARGTRFGSDWTSEVRRSRLALDLRVRSRFLRFYLGEKGSPVETRRRATVERLFVESSDALTIGCEHFAARPHDARRVARVLLRSVRVLLGKEFRERSLFWPECG